MKHYFLLISFVWGYFVNGYLQAKPGTIQTSGTSNLLTSVFFIDSTTGYVVGDKGTILKTNNGGTNWTHQSSGTTSALYSVYFVNVTSGWVVGENGLILKTLNGGSSWTRQTSGLSTDNLNSVFFIDSNSGYIVTMSGTIIKTIDGGNTWVKQKIGDGFTALNSVYFLDINTGYAVGNSSHVKIVFKTTDGGTTWNLQNSGLVKGNLGKVHFTNTNTGYAVGNDESGNASILKTTDGGLSWVEQTVGKRALLYSVNFTDANNGFATGDGGFTIRTTDGGVNWTAISDRTYGPFDKTYNPHGKSNTMLSIFFVNDTTGWEVGANGIILKYMLSSENLVRDVEGNAYGIVRIGTQTWMKENLRVTRYKDNTAIPCVTDNAAWAALNTPAYCWFKNDPATYKNPYGALYNGYAVSTGKLCPAGWHISTDEDWTTMINYLMNNGFSTNPADTRDVAKSASATSLWRTSTTTGAVGNTDYPTYRNVTGFSALPCGYREIDGKCNWDTFFGVWYTPSKDNLNYYYHQINYNGLFIYRGIGTLNMVYGYSVRCVKDN